MDAPTELYTPQSLRSLGFSTFMVMVVTGIATKLGWQDPWLVSLCFSELIAIAGLCILPPDHWKKFGRTVVIFIGLCNGLLIYSQATGVNAINHGLPSPISTPADQATLIDFGSVPWWPPVDQSQAARDAVDALRSGANATEQVVEGMTDLVSPIRDEITALESNLETIRNNRAATIRGLESGAPSERLALEQNLARLDASEKDTLATVNKLRAAAQAIDPAVTAVMLRTTRERLSSATKALAGAAAHAESIWEPVWRSAPFKPVAHGR